MVVLRAVLSTDVSVVAVVFLLNTRVTVARLSDAEPESTRVDGTVAPEQQEGEDGLGDDIQDAVEDGLGVRVDDIASLSNTPGNRVKEPDKDCQDAADVVGTRDGAAEDPGMAAAVDEQRVDDKEESTAGEDKISPLVRGASESADEAADNHNLISQNGDEDGRPGKASCEEKVEKQKRRRHEPVDVSDVEYFARACGSDLAAADKLDSDGDLAEVAAHAKVGDGGNKEQQGRDIVEEAVRLGLGKGPGHDDQG